MKNIGNLNNFLRKKTRQNE